MKTLISGGSGFIGTHLVGDLKGSGHQAVIYDKAPSHAYPDDAILGDVRDLPALKAAMKGVQAVYHLAAEHKDDVRPRDLYYEVNVGGAGNLIEAMEEHNVSKLIFTSSVAVYGLNVGVPTEDSPLSPFNDYGRSKMQAEDIFLEWQKRDPNRMLVIVRPVVIFGPKNRGNVYNLLYQIHKGRFFMVGSGRNVKSMGYVKNISLFLRFCLDMEPGAHVFNYADKPDLTTRELVGSAHNALGRKKPKFAIPYPLGLSAGYLFDIMSRITGKSLPISSIRIRKFAASTEVSADKMRRSGFVQPYSLSEALKETIESDFIQ